jgi:hypothetical protein
MSTSVVSDASSIPGLILCTGSAEEFCNIVYALQCELQPRVVVRMVRGKNMGSVSALFSEFAAALQFPCYFGKNWNAFDECVADLEWLPGDGYVVLIVDGSNVLDAASEDREVFFRIMASVAREWSGVRGLPFQTFVQCLDDEADVIRRSFTEPSAAINVSELKATVLARYTSTQV